MYLDEGFSDYLSKPVNPEKLEDMIRQYLPKEYLENYNSEPEFDFSDSENEKADFDLSGIKGIDLEAALKNCGGKELLAVPSGNPHFGTG